MNWQRINIKLFLENPADNPLSAYIPVFHRVIQRRALPGLLIDIHDYSHMHRGPGILLVAHEANYAIDNSDGELGALVSYKLPLEGTNAAKLKQVFEWAVALGTALEKALELRLSRPKVSGGDFEISLNDRLNCPHTESTREAFVAELRPLLDALLGADCYEIATGTDPRRRLSARVRSTTPLTLKELGEQLGSPG